MAHIYILNRRIILPKRLDTRLKTLAGLNQETSGVLLYETKGTDSELDLIVESLYMTGRSERLNVEIEAERKEIINDFLASHLEYRHIEWHTHITGNKGISRDDRDHYAQELENNPYFIAMIVRPNGRTIVKSRNSGIVRTIIVPTPNDFDMKKRYLRQELKSSARRIGLGSLPRLKATRKKSI